MFPTTLIKSDEGNITTKSGIGEHGRAPSFLLLRVGRRGKKEKKKQRGPHDLLRHYGEGEKRKREKRGGVAFRQKRTECPAISTSFFRCCWRGKRGREREGNNKICALSLAAKRKRGWALRRTEEFSRLSRGRLRARLKRGGRKRGKDQVSGLRLSTSPIEGRGHGRTARAERTRRREVFLCRTVRKEREKGGKKGELLMPSTRSRSNNR